MILEIICYDSNQKGLLLVTSPCEDHSNARLETRIKESFIPASARVFML